MADEFFEKQLRERAVAAMKQAGLSVQEISRLIADRKSLRDEFAMAALTGQIHYEGMEGCDEQHLAAMSYQLADAMMEGIRQYFIKNPPLARSRTV